MSVGRHHQETTLRNRKPSESLEGNASSRWLPRAQQWLASAERLGGKAEEAHIARHGDCACLPDLWLPTRKGFSDWYAIETCGICGIRFYEAYENEASRVRRQADAEREGPLSGEWDAILTIAFLEAAPGDRPSDVVVCGCCWDTYSAPPAHVVQPSTVEGGAPA